MVPMVPPTKIYGTTKNILNKSCTLIQKTQLSCRLFCSNLLWARHYLPNYTGNTSGADKWSV